MKKENSTLIKTPPPLRPLGYWDRGQRKKTERQKVDMAFNGMKTIPAAHDELLDGKRAAQFLGVSYQTLFRMRNRGEIPVVLGSKMRFRQSDLARALRERAAK